MSNKIKILRLYTKLTELRELNGALLASDREKREIYTKKMRALETKIREIDAFILSELECISW